VTHVDTLPIKQDLTGIRLDHPIEDFHQRRLAGPILTQQGMYFTLTELEINSIKSKRTSTGFYKCV